jgi:hypothetical protein
VRLYASTRPGLEELLAEELVERGLGSAVEAGKGLAVFGAGRSLHVPLPLLACDRAGILVRVAEGDFAGPRGLSELCGKLARTQFDRGLASLARLGARRPRTVRVQATVSPRCGFMFFDAQRETAGIVARRTELEHSGNRADVVVDIDVQPVELRIGLLLPLAWPELPALGSRPRSVTGALLRLAQPSARLTACDPDCGAGELLRAWREVVREARLIGLAGHRPARAKAESPDLPLVVSHSRAWPIADGRLSRVLTANPHLRAPADLARLLEETARCLALGGRAVLMVRSEGPFRRVIEAEGRLAVDRSVVLRGQEETERIVALRRESPRSGHRTAVTAGDRARATRKLGGVVAGRQQERRRKPARPRPLAPKRPNP